MSRRIRRKKRNARKKFLEETCDQLMKIPSGTVRRTKDGHWEVFIPKGGWHLLRSDIEMYKMESGKTYPLYGGSKDFSVGAKDGKSKG